MISNLRRVFGIDTALIASTIAIIASSLYVLATAIVRPSGGIDASYAHRQLIFTIIGVVLAVIIARVPLHFWARWWPHILVGTILSLVLVRIVGTEINGAKSWIDFGLFSLQPSEFGKATMLIVGAAFIAARYRDMQSVSLVAQVLLLLGVPAAIVLVQPDLGTAQIYGWIALGLLFFAGARWLHLTILCSALFIVVMLVMVILPAVGMPVLKPYQMQRLTGFLNPEADAQNANYQTIQAKVAIGSGQLFGRSAEEATQVQQGFLPEPQTDFIFATMVERYGFVGGGALLGLYVLLISRMLYAAGVASTIFARLIAGGAATIFASQVFTNIGMVVGVLPVTGVPLPMYSYGGSSLWTSMMLVGFVLAVLREAEAPDVRYERRTGRPASGYGSLRAASSERALRPADASSRSPLTNTSSKRRRVRRRSRSRGRRSPS